MPRIRDWLARRRQAKKRKAAKKRVKALKGQGFSAEERRRIIERKALKARARELKARGGLAPPEKRLMLLKDFTRDYAQTVGAEGELKELILGLGHLEEKRRKGVAESLGSIMYRADHPAARDGRLVKPLRYVLKLEPSDKVKREIVDALALHGDRKAIQALEKRLESGDRHQRIGAMNILAEALPKKYSHVSIKALAHDKDVEVRRWAVRNLARAGDEKAVQALIEKGMTDASHIVRKEAVEILMELKAPIKDKVYKQLLKEENDYVRNELIHAALAFEDKRVASHLLERLEKDNTSGSGVHMSSREKDMAIVFFGAVGDEEAIDRFGVIITHRPSGPFGPPPPDKGLLSRWMKVKTKGKTLALAELVDHPAEVVSEMALERLEPKIFKGKNKAETKKLRLAEEFFRGLPKKKVFLLLAAIASKPQMMKQIPSNLNDRTQRSKFEYLQTLKHQAQNRSFKEMLDILEL